MAESTAGRKRATSNASSRQGRARAQSRVIPSTASSHVNDPFLEDFRSPGFDPAAYLNASLSPLLPRQPRAARAPQDAVTLAELSAQMQRLATQLDTHVTRLSDTLTQLTDDILRSGSRLAYKVELLRGETLSFQEAMNETLGKDIAQFVPGGLQGEGRSGHVGESDHTPGAPGTDSAQVGASKDESHTGNPEYIEKLQMLTLVRSRLEEVIKTFGDAMDFVFPPSEVSVGSGFLSVSAPEPGSQQQSSEEKGQQVLRNLRSEVSGLLTKSSDPVEGIEKAASRIEQLKELGVVWKGTAEEKGRNKFIESLTKMVEDRHRELTREMEQAAKKEGRVLEPSRPRKGSVTRNGDVGDDDGTKTNVPGGFGLISQLQRLRTGLN